MLYTPDITANVTANYTWVLTDATSAFVLADYEYTGKSYGSFQVSTPDAPNPSYIDPAYSVVNLNVGVNWALRGVAVCQEPDSTTHHPAVSDHQRRHEGYTLRPLTVGMALQAKF